MSKTVGIVQARMGASRLPNKMMLCLHGYPVIEWVRRRASLARAIDALVFALPNTPDNDVLDDFLSSRGANVFRGSENDVLDRFYQVAVAYGASRIVRICADNPLVSGSEIDRLVEFFSETDCDYAYNHIPRHNRYPDGLGAEMVKMTVLEEIHREARMPEFREHVFNYIHAHPGRFTVCTFDPESDALCHPEVRMDIDTMADYRKLMNLEIRIDMTARQAVDAMLERKRHEDS